MLVSIYELLFFTLLLTLLLLLLFIHEPQYVAHAYYIFVAPEILVQ